MVGVIYKKDFSECESGPTSCSARLSSSVDDFDALETLVDSGDPDADLLAFATVFLPGASVGDTDR